LSQPVAKRISNPIPATRNVLFITLDLRRFDIRVQARGKRPNPAHHA
jgi:hypothetical protein